MRRMREWFGANKARWAVVLLAAGMVAGCGGESKSQKSGAKKSLSVETKNYLELGEKYMLEGKRQQAIDAFSSAIKSDPDCKEAYGFRAMLYNESNQRDKALADYSKAIDLDPTDNYAYAERAKIYRKMGQTAEADADEEKAASLRGEEWKGLRGKDYDRKRK
ncbi:MAG TPA: tetratricopeptide repeat protein [Thermoguttaceae bacterium]|nr:tetratricopeptide repeat protein [Thermoguttaceae bacterium]